MGSSFFTTVNSMFDEVKHQYVLRMLREQQAKAIQTGSISSLRTKTKKALYGGLFWFMNLF